ncbi:anthranilate phosphoribosyltransferase [Streptomyces sp. GBA 94-10 4N24]|uniref:anthranilate phosphoribosyltransferase n=1 Tax=Streptomyces TaxID=1883 RepID=UPI0003C2D703|nr:anthranilate phosphoribosyltransferase [Streptomyces sp. GBA 94-10 4N24]ESP99309.1 anthranilate phosphoribosyltransferase [Streptomyces sp. GBA 94-10 4N24]UZN59817.1 anthranilate phosphoribosyltransferase [Streptomyces sp. GBA 94-10 4N24]
MAVTAPLLAHKINSPADIAPEDVHDGITRILALPEGPTRDVMLGSVLTGLLLRGPRLEEVEAAIRAATDLDRKGWDFYHPPAGVRFVGYTGSGKKTFKTINLSTAAALVAATGGAHIAKLGSRSASSKTGSRDFIDEIGATSDSVPHQEMVDITAEIGFGFFSIENRVPEFDRRYGGRFQAVHALSLAFPALLSPVACPAYVYGLSHPAVGASARLLSTLGLPDVTVMNSGLGKAAQVDELLPGTQVRACRINAGEEDLMFNGDVRRGAASMPRDLTSVAQHENPQENVAAAVRLLAGQDRSQARNAVALNAALLLVMSEAVPTIQTGIDKALAIIEAGAALDTLRQFVRLTGGAPQRVRALMQPAAPAAVLVSPGKREKAPC